MARVRRSALVRGGTTTDGEEDKEDLDGVEEFSSSLNDLVAETQPATFDRTWVVTKDDVPVATTEAVPVPQPWQGIPRVGMLFNFNYVWDDTAEEWVRQHPFEGGGGKYVAAAFQEFFTDVSVGVNDRERIDLTDVQLEDGANVDTTNDEILVDEAGNYEVVAAASVSGFSDGAPLPLDVTHDGSTVGVNDPVPTNVDTANVNIQTTARVLDASAGDAIHAGLTNNGSTSVTIDGAQSETWITVQKLV